MGIQELPSGPDVPAVGGADGGLDDVDVGVGCVGEDCVVEVVFGGVFGTACAHIQRRSVSKEEHTCRW